MPSATLLGQALISGVLAGGMYGLLALGLSLSWGLLRLVNLSHFALAFLAAYLTYELGTTYHVAPWWSAAMVVPVMFVIGAGPALAVRPLQGERACLAADHLQLRRHPRSRRSSSTGPPTTAASRRTTRRMSIKVGRVLHPGARARALHGGGRAGLGHLAVAAQDLCRQGPARRRRGRRHRRGLRRRPQEARLSAVGHGRGLCRRSPAPSSR